MFHGTLGRQQESTNAYFDWLLMWLTSPNKNRWCWPNANIIVFCIESSSAFIRTSISIIVPAPEPSGVDTVLTEGMGLEIATGLAVYLQRFPLVSLLLRFESGWILMLLRWLFLGWRHFAHFFGGHKKDGFLISTWWWVESAESRKGTQKAWLNFTMMVNPTTNDHFGSFAGTAPKLWA